EASPIWIGSDPADGQWNMYTAAWSAVRIDRAANTIVQEMYLPESAQGLPVFQDNKPDPEFSKVGNDLAQGKFTTLQERNDLLAKALTLALQDSLQVFLIDGKAYVPYADKVQVTADLAAGVQGAQIWPFTARLKDQVGGTLKMGNSDLFTDPWNPVAGSNWAWDQGVIKATSSGDQLYDPYTGLLMALRADHATLTVKEGLPVFSNLDWVTLETAPEIKVPGDTWVDWDAKAQKWITADEKYPDGITALRKSVEVFPADLWTTVKWHDGSPISMGDIMMSLIYTFDRAEPDSKIYDESYVPNFDSFMASFKGFKITSTDPLTFEYYSDYVQQDAELNIGS
ncbi:MAG: ABC transporter substrate-binding protein, partial [Bacteroidota bacterium]|nr:ABC transporter substrate-binding protein [Bacteroidota bacterium]